MRPLSLSEAVAQTWGRPAAYTCTRKASLFATGHTWFGYCGHFATKSRAYSTTYSALREERRAHRDVERREAHGLPPMDGRNAVIDAK